ncbi:hypothetical protein [Calothrix sp. PCC 7507]|uniref:hypothetical protein n=1 Tax=Calothrix sp. PCC 7507 TaxID=99598 RepID=UPI0002EB67EC|nr:hypothetical protein [Calothrix sp. PCC 7507]
MKEIADSYKKSLESPVSLLQLKTLTTAIAPLQIPDETIISDWERLIIQAQRINQMAAELEVMLREFKAIATRLNSQNVCDYLTVRVPWIKHKSDESFVLTTRKVDLFRAEREASLLAQQLRQQTRKKALRLQRYGNSKADTADSNLVNFKLR